MLDRLVVVSYMDCSQAVNANICHIYTAKRGTPAVFFFPAGASSNPDCISVGVTCAFMMACAVAGEKRAATGYNYAMKERELFEFVMGAIMDDVLSLVTDSGYDQFLNEGSLPKILFVGMEPQPEAFHSAFAMQVGSC